MNMKRLRFALVRAFLLTNAISAVVALFCGVIYLLIWEFQNPIAGVAGGTVMGLFMILALIIWTEND